MTQQYKPGDKLEILVQGAWQHGGRKYVGLTEGGKIVYEMDRSVFTLIPDSVRKLQVEHKKWGLKKGNELFSLLYPTRDAVECAASLSEGWTPVEITWKE